MAPVHEISAAPVAPSHLKVLRPQNPYVALGLAANHLMTKPAFANLRFGDWSRVLVGQINRKHYCFAVDSTNQIQGFIGWALTSKEMPRPGWKAAVRCPSRTAWTAIAWSSTRGQRARAR